MSGRTKNLLAELRRRNVYLAQAVPLTKTPLEWIHVMPVGRWEEFRGLGPGWGDPLEITAEHIAQMVTNFTRYGHDLLIDYEHAHLWGETKAAGWIDAVEARADGLWAKPRWTAAARQQIADEEYRYLSPAFDLAYKDAATGERIGARLRPVGLTNDPFFEVGLEQKLAARETIMDELKQVAAALGLPETATLDEILAAIAELKAKLAEQAEEPAAAAKTKSLTELLAAVQTKLTALKSAAQIVTAVRSELQLSATADTAAITAALKLRGGNQASLAAEVATLSTKLAAREAAELVAQAVAEGKLAAATVPWATQFATADADGFRTWAASAPRVVPLGGPPPRGPEGDAPTVTEADRTAARAVGGGVTAEQIARQRTKRTAN